MTKNKPIYKDGWWSRVNPADAFSDARFMNWAETAFISDALKKGEKFYKVRASAYVGDDADAVIRAIDSFQPGKVVFETLGDGLENIIWVWDTGIADAVRHPDGDVSVNAIGTDREILNKISNIVKNNAKRRKSEGRVYVIVSSAGGPTFTPLGVAAVPLERDNYSKDVIDSYDYSIDDLNSVSPSGRLSIFDGSPGTGKCVAAGTEVMDARSGAITPIEHIVRSESDVLTYRGEQGVVPTRPSHWLSTGVKRCLELSTSAGRGITVTPEHPLMTVDGWKRADSIREGDYIASARHIPCGYYPERIPDDHIVLIASLLADGGYTHNHVSFTKSDKDIVDTVDSALRCVGGGLRQYKCHDSYEYRVFSEKVGRDTKIRMLLNSYGIGNEGARDKKIPEAILKAPEDQIARFIGVLWSCDGSIDGRGTIELGMSSENIVRRIQHLLLRVGIISNVKKKITKYKGEDYTSWRCTIVSTSRHDFINRIPLIGKIKDIADGLNLYENPNDDLIPLTQNLRQKLKLIFDRAVLSLGRNAVADTFEWKRPKGPYARDIIRSDRDHISRKTAIRLRSLVCDDILDHLLSLRWEKVASIHDAGDHSVFDLTVPKGNCFIANDLLAHNTFIIRGMISEVEDAMFVLVPPNMLDSLSSPSLIPALIEFKNNESSGPIVFVLEDSDNVLVPRGKENMSLISTLLNMSSGMLGSLLDIRVVATTNSPKRDIDPALMRDGRLSTHVTVGNLNPDHANRLLKKLTGKNKNVFDSDVPLAKVYKAARSLGWKPGATEGMVDSGIRIIEEGDTARIVPPRRRGHDPLS